MSNHFSEEPLVADPYGNATRVNLPPSTLEAYFQGQNTVPGGTDCKPCSEETAVDSPGYDLPCAFTDPVFKDEDLTLLARCGKKLAAFKGSGVLVVKNGKASLVECAPIKVSELWHRFEKLHGQVIPAEPKPAPFMAVADGGGKVHAIGGLKQGASALVNDRNKGGWNVVPTGQLPKDHEGRLPESPCLQLTGYKPLDALQHPNVTRDIEALGGQGIVFLSKISAPPSTCTCGSSYCCCEHTEQTVAKVVPFPGTGGGCECQPGVCYTLEFCDGVVSFRPVEPSSLPQNLLGNS